MRVPVWAHDLAHGFWTTVGAAEALPRTLEASIESACDVTVKRMPHLSLASLTGWLAISRIHLPAQLDRALCGCLVAERGRAFLFVDAADSADEQRYSLAHELAHYLRDVWYPRQRVLRVLGPAGAELCDGRRTPTRAERVAAAIEGIRLNLYLHLLPRDANGQPATAAIADHEECADVLACELLAPAAHLAAAGAAAWTADEWIERLTRDYGVPRREATRYLQRVRPSKPRVDSWLRSLRAGV